MISQSGVPTKILLTHIFICKNTERNTSGFESTVFKFEKSSKVLEFERYRGCLCVPIGRNSVKISMLANRK